MQNSMGSQAIYAKSNGNKYGWKINSQMFRRAWSHLNINNTLFSLVRIDDSTPFNINFIGCHFSYSNIVSRLQLKQRLDKTLNLTIHKCSSRNKWNYFVTAGNQIRNRWEWVQRKILKIFYTLFPDDFVGTFRRHLQDKQISRLLPYWLFSQYCSGAKLKINTSFFK